MDALAALVTLLRPHAIMSKRISGRGRWGVRYPAFGQPSFALVLHGGCLLAVDGGATAALNEGDFVLFPATPGFTMASDPTARPRLMEAKAFDHHVDHVIHGEKAGKPSVSLLGGYFAFDPVNAAMLTGLLPRMLHIRASDPAVEYMKPIVALVRRETGEKRAGQNLVLNHLIEIMLVEALRSAPGAPGARGVLAGLQDSHLAAALRGIHTRPAHPWTLVTLARAAGMSRSAFADRFARVIGATPLAYLLQWRMAVAKNMLLRDRLGVAETAFAVGYQSASAFSTAFSRETGTPPRAFADAGLKAAA